LTFHFEVVDDRQLTPAVMLSSVYQTLQGTNAAAAEQSYRLSGEIDVAGQPGVKLRGIMAPNGLNTGAIQSALYMNERFEKAYGNAVEQPVVTGLHLRIEAIPERRTAVLESARLSRTEAHAGETVEVEVTLHPYQSKTQVIRIPVTLPATLTPGMVRIVVSDGGAVDRMTSPSGAVAQHAVGLADTVAQMNRAHSNDKIYVTLLEHSVQAVLETNALPEIPLSMANVLEPLKDDQRMQLSGESALALGSADVEYVVTGSQVLRLLVR